jgi:hypothetical protein
MKNTTFRKKALLSSVAMLLVALVALGSATFAWFSSNKVVTADGMDVKAAAAKGLQISNKNESGWANAVTFEQDPITLTPVSLDTTATSLVGYAPEVVNVLGGGVWNDTNKNDITTFGEVAIANVNGTAGVEAFGKNGSFAAYKVDVRSSGEEISGITGTIVYDKGANADYIRIAVIKDNAVIKTFGNEPKATANAIKNDTPQTQDQTLTAIDNAENNSNVFVEGLSVSNTDVASYTFLVWFEGQDTDCIDEKQALEGGFTVKFSY